MADQTVKMRLVRYEGKKKIICYPQTTADQILGLDAKLEGITGSSEAKTLANTALTTAAEAKSLANDAKNAVENLNLTSDQITQIRNLINSDITGLQTSVNELTSVANTANTNANAAIEIANGAASSIDILESRISSIEQNSGSGGTGTIDLTSINNSINEIRTIATNAEAAINTAIENNSAAYTIAQNAADRVSEYDALITNATTAANSATDAADNAMTAATSAAENATNALLNIEDLRIIATEANTNAATALTNATSANNNVNTLQTEFTTLNENFAQLEAAISSISGISSANNYAEVIADISRIDETLTTQNTSISSILANMRENNTAITNINAAITEINTSLSSIINDVSLNDTSLANLRTDVENISTKLNTIDTDISALKLGGTSTISRLTAIEEEFNEYIPKINSIDSDVTDLKNKVTTAENNINTLTVKTDTAVSDITSIKEKMDYVYEVFTSRVIKTEPSINDIQYNGSAQSITVNNFDIFRMSMSGDTVGTAIGEYTISVTPNSGYTWNDNTTDPKTITWNIVTGILPIPEIDTDMSIVYDGTEKAPVFKSYNTNLITISGNTTGTDAGTYQATATITDSNYEFDIIGGTSTVIEWTIERNNSAHVPSQTTTIEYDGTEKTPSWQTIVNNETIDGYETNKLNVSGTTAATDIGSYEAIFTPNNNYAWEDRSFDGVSVTWRIVPSTQEQGSESGSEQGTQEQGSESGSESGSEQGTQEQGSESGSESGSEQGTQEQGSESGSESGSEQGTQEQGSESGSEQGS